MKILLGVLIAFGFLVFILLFVYLRNRFGLKDKNLGGIQRSPKLPPPKPPEEAFLPGSVITRSAAIAEVLEELEKRPRIIELSGEKRKHQHRLFLTKKDVLRSYIVDTLLDKPKF